MSACGGSRQGAIECVFEVAAEFIVPGNPSVGADHDDRRKRRDPKRVDRCVGTVAIYPCDAVLLDEGFAFCFALGSFGSQSDELNTLVVILTIGLDQTLCRSGTRASPVRPDIDDHYFPGQLRIAWFGAIQPAFGNDWRRRSTDAHGTACLFHATAGEQHHRCQ